MQVITWELLD